MSTVMPLRSAALRFGDWGPGYLVQDEDAAFGLLVLRPGDEFANHLHDEHVESFFVVTGGIEIWFDRDGPVHVGEHQLVRAYPGVEHFVRNPGPVPAHVLFIKTPWAEGDKTDVPWRPGPSAGE